MTNISREALREAGMRMTSQRNLIINIIRQGHLNADEIYRRARQKDRRLSLSTVYRTLQVLKKLGLVEEIHLDDYHHHYEVKPTTEHYHLVCLGCGKVVEFQYPISQYLKKNEIATGFHYPIPLHLQKCFKDLGYKQSDFPVSEKLAEEGISLPMYPELSNEQISFVADNIRQFFQNKC